LSINPFRQSKRQGQSHPRQSTKGNAAKHGILAG
jgi:hypothetical protein